MLGQGSLGGLAVGQPEEFGLTAELVVAVVTITQVTNATVVVEVPGVNVGFS